MRIKTHVMSLSASLRGFKIIPSAEMQFASVTSVFVTWGTATLDRVSFNERTFFLADACGCPFGRKNFRIFAAAQWTAEKRWPECASGWQEVGSSGDRRLLMSVSRFLFLTLRALRWPDNLSLVSDVRSDHANRPPTHSLASCLERQWPKYKWTQPDRANKKMGAKKSLPRLTLARLTDCVSCSGRVPCSSFSCDLPAALCSEVWTETSHHTVSSFSDRPELVARQSPNGAAPGAVSQAPPTGPADRRPASPSAPVRFTFLSAADILIPHPRDATHPPAATWRWLDAGRAATSISHAPHPAKYPPPPINNQLASFNGTKSSWTRFSSPWMALHPFFKLFCSSTGRLIR